MRNLKQHLLRLGLLFGASLAASACDHSLHGIVITRDGGDGGGRGDGQVYDFGQGLDVQVSHTDAKCANAQQEVGLLPLDMLIALDTSFSMDFAGKWTAVRQAVKKFSQNPLFNGLGVGVQYFPLRKQCSVADYQNPAVPFDVLPAVQQTVADSLDAQRMSGGTPMVPMLDGVLSYARTWVTNNPERKVVVVLATDGVPDDSCLAPTAGALPNTIDNVVKLAKDGVAGSPSISTFVVGVGSELTALNQISQAGNGAAAILVDTASDIEAAFLAALNQIRRRALACAYAIPPPEGGQIDFERVNVFFRSQGESELLVNVMDEAGCAKAPKTAWFYDNPVAPKQIVLCPDVCDRVLASPDGKLDVEFGCATVIR